jgi:membrane protein DedA with SNARE-associated domain
MKELLHDFIQLVLPVIEQFGYWGIMLGLMIEVIPSEIVLAFGGYLVSKGELTFWGAVLFGTIGGTVAQMIVYGVGRYGGRPVLEKYGKYILIDKRQFDLSEHWFNKYGIGLIFFGRFVPVVRHAISIPAGIARVPLSKFTVLTALAVIPWSMGFIYLGMILKDNWGTMHAAAAPYLQPIIFTAAVLMAGYVLWAIHRK